MAPRGAAAAALFVVGISLALPASALPPCDLSKTGDEVCDAFCNHRCSFYNRTAGERPITHNVTLYRLTPRNVTGLRNKNSGDPAGDVGFWLAKKNMSVACARGPPTPDCVAAGNAIYGRFIVEVDGEWGPYTECNPLQLGGDDPARKPQWINLRRFVCGSDCIMPTEKGCQNDDPAPFRNQSRGMWGPQCRCDGTRRELRSVGRVAPDFLVQPDSEGKLVPASWGAQCQQGYQALWQGWCLHGFAYGEVRGWSTESALALACDACRLNPNCTGWTTYDDRTVKLFEGRVWPSPGLCRSAGADLSDKDKSWDGVARLGGRWFATPVDGECPRGMSPGDDGCTWREVASVYKNSSCVDGHVDRNVEAWGAACFERCPFPLDRSSDCYMECYRDVIMGNPGTNVTKIPSDLVLHPWIRSFNEDDPSKGGCPPIAPEPCSGEQCDPLVPSEPWLDAATFVV